MTRRILWSWGILALAVALAAAVLPGFDVKEGILGYVIVALVFGLVNSLIGPIARLIALPITLMTLGNLLLCCERGDACDRCLDHSAHRN